MPCDFALGICLWAELLLVIARVYCGHIVCYIVRGGLLFSFFMRVFSGRLCVF